MKIETLNLILRPWRESDAEALYKYASDERIGPAAGWPAHKSVEESLGVIRDVLSAPHTYAVTLKRGGIPDEPIGSVGLVDCRCPDFEEEREIGYWLGVPFWGNGLIPEAVEAMLDCCFDWLGCQRVWCGHFEENQKSKRVIEKCGFDFAFEREMDVVLLGEHKNELFYSITREKWAARREEQRRLAESMML